MANNTETRRVKVITDAQQSTASINQLRASAASLRKELNKTQRGTGTHDKLSKEYQKVNNELKKARSQVNGLNLAQKRFWTNAKAAMAGFMATNVITAISQAIFGFVQNVVTYSKTMADAFSGIIKTTGLTRKEVQLLNKELGELDTRTSKKVLLDLAQQAGKLGITGVQNIKEFVKAADQINVALGDELGEGGVKNIAKLNDVFGETKRLGIEKSMIATASAINSLGQAGTTSEGYLVDFTKRLAGVAKQSDISIGSILGIGATLDELGLSSELSSTALTRMFIQMQKDSGTYARIAGINVSRFNRLLKEDANAAFVEFLEGLNNNSDGLQELAKNFEQLGLDGARSIQVVSALSQNTEKLTEKQKLATNEFIKGDSVLKEFNENNTNFAAKMQKAWKALVGLFMNNPITKVITGLLNGLANLIIKLDNYNDVVQDTVNTEQDRIDKFNILIEKLKYGNLHEKDRRDLINHLNREYKEYLPSLLKESDSIDAIATKQENANKILMRNIVLKKNQARISSLMSDIQKADIRASEARNELLLNTGDPNDVYDRMNNPTGKTDGKKITRLNKIIAQASIEIVDAKAAIDKIAMDQEEQLKRLGNVFGMGLDGGSGDDGGSGGNGGSGISADSGKSSPRVKQEEDKLQELLTLANLYYQKKEIALKNALLSERITEDEFKVKQVENEIDHQKQILQMTEEHGESTLDAEEKITDLRLELKKLTADEEITIEEQVTEAIDGELEKRKRQRENANQFAISTAEQTYAELQRMALRNLRNEVESVTNSRLTTLETAKEKEIAMAGDNAEQKAKIEEEYTRKRNAILLEDAKKKKDLALFEIAINTARAIVQANLDYGPAAPVAIAAIAGLAAAQTAAVLSAPLPEFYSGGSTMVQGQSGSSYYAKNAGSFASGGRVNSASYGIIGERGPELVVPNHLYTAPEWQSTMSSIERAIGMPEYAAGGVTPNNSGTSSPEMAMMLSVLMKLDKRLSSPIEAMTYFDESKYNSAKQGLQATRKIANGLLN